MSEEEKYKRNKRLFYEYYKTKRTREFLDQYDHEKAWNRLVSNKKRNKKKLLFFASAAASIVIIILFSLLKIDLMHEIEPVHIIVTEESESKKTDNAILTLSDGTRIILNNSVSDKFIEDGALKLDAGANSHLSYKQTETKDTSSINQLIIPRGKEYKLCLSDGTEIWLNAETKLCYPVQFGSVREVELEGEAYFEVAPDKTRPFRVKSKEGTIEVLGTHFNVSAYPSSTYETTLAEGKVAVKTKDKRILLNPDQQLVLEINGDYKINEVDAAEYTSWINGIYKFSDKPLCEITTQLTRWYDIEFAYETPQTQYRRFNGLIDKKENLEFVLSLLTDISGIQFQVVNNKVIIK